MAKMLAIALALVLAGASAEDADATCNPESVRSAALMQTRVELKQGDASKEEHLHHGHKGPKGGKGPKRGNAATGESSSPNFPDTTDDTDMELTELTLLAAASDDTANLTAEAWERIGWTPLIRVEDSTHQSLNMLDHAWVFSKGSTSVAVFSATNDVVDEQQMLLGLASDPVEFCGFAMNSGLVQEVQGYMQAPNWENFIEVLNSDTCKKVISVGHSLGGGVASVFAACTNKGDQRGFGNRSDFGLVTFAPVAPAIEPLYSGTPGTPFVGTRYGVTETDGGENTHYNFRDSSKLFRLDLLDFFKEFAELGGRNDEVEQIQAARRAFEGIPDSQIEASWEAGPGPMLRNFLLPVVAVMGGAHPGVERLAPHAMGVVQKLMMRGELFFKYDPISSFHRLSPRSYSHPLVDFQGLSDTPGVNRKTASSTTSELPRADPFRFIFAILASGNNFPHHQICCYHQGPDCAMNFGVGVGRVFKVCQPTPLR